MLLIFLPCQVSFDGVIGFDNPSLGECGTDSTRLADKFIAVYWLPNTDGLVTFFEANAASRQFEKDKANLINDINKAFNMNPVNIQEKDIEHVLYVTWNSMRNSQNFQAQVRRNYDNIRNENIWILSGIYYKLFLANMKNVWQEWTTDFPQFLIMIASALTLTTFCENWFNGNCFFTNLVLQHAMEGDFSLTVK